MANVAELAAKIELKGAKEASKAVTDLTSKFGFLGNVAVGVFKGLTWGVEQLNDLRDGAREYAREIDIMTFRNRIGAESFQRLEQAFKQYGGNIKDFISVYDNLQSRQARWKRFGLDQNEGLAFGMLGINPGDYKNALDLMSAITQRLNQMKNIGDRNFVADILGINDEYLRIASKGDYSIFENLIMSDAEQKELEDQQKAVETLNIALEGLKKVLGTKWGMLTKGLTQAMAEVAMDMANAAAKADGFWSALWNVAKVGAKGTINAIRNSVFGNYNFNPEVEKAVFNTLAEEGLDRTKIAGIMGNIAQESSFNPAAYRANDSDGRPSGGLIQWHGERLTNLQSFAQKRGKSWDDARVQMQFLMHELRNNKKWKYYLEHDFGTPEEAGKWFMENIEIPHPDYAHEENRLNAAKYYGNFSPNPEIDNYRGVETNAAVSESNKQITVNNYIQTDISTDNVDKGWMRTSFQPFMEEILNETSMTISGDRNGS